MRAMREVDIPSNMELKFSFMFEFLDPRGGTII